MVKMHLKFCEHASAVGCCASCDDVLPLEGFYPAFVSGTEGLVPGPWFLDGKDSGKRFYSFLPCRKDNKKETKTCSKDIRHET